MRSARPAIPALIALLAAALVLGAGVGAVPVGLRDLADLALRALGGAPSASADPRAAAVLLEIRLPRLALGALVGATLAASGAAMQGLFRNPLVDPGLLGISAGAALGAVGAIVAGAPPIAVPAAAFAGGLAAIAVATRVARVGGRLPTASLLLAGIAVQSLAGAGVGYLIFGASDAQLRTATFWLLGGLGGASWASLGVAAPLLAVALIGLAAEARALNALLLGETEAAHLGVPVDAVKRRVVAWVTLGVGASVAAAGAIGFVGLIAPHALRLVVGPDHRRLIPASALAGAALLVGADVAARTCAAPAELPVGVVTAAAGAPIFLVLLRATHARIEALA